MATRSLREPDAIAKDMSEAARIIGRAWHETEIAT